MSLYSNLHGGCVPPYPPGCCNISWGACCPSSCAPVSYCGPGPLPPPPTVSPPFPLVPLEYCQPCGGWDYCVSGIDRFPCPPDKSHKHWTPHIGTCRWPEPCPADCFDHSQHRDWIDVRSKSNYGKVDRMDDLLRFCKEYC